jgi:hypothetical protein
MGSESAKNPEGARPRAARPRTQGTARPPATDETPDDESAEPVRVADAIRPRRALQIGAAALCAGLCLVGTGPSDAGMVVTLGALLVLVYGVHSFGRLGPA